MIDHTGNVLCAVKALAIKSKWSVWKKKASNTGAVKVGGAREGSIKKDERIMYRTASPCWKVLDGNPGWAVTDCL